MTKLTRELVDAVGDAFNANNIEAVMQYFAPNATFDHAVGPDTHGARFEGAEVIRGVFSGLFDKGENVHWETLDGTLTDTKTYCEYRRTARHKDWTNEHALRWATLSVQSGRMGQKDTAQKQQP